MVRRIATLFTFSDEYTTHAPDLERHLRNWNFSSTLKACFFAIRSALSDDPQARGKFHRLAAINNRYLDIDEISLYPQCIPAMLALRDAHGDIPLTIRAALASRDGSPLPTELTAEYSAYYLAAAASDLSLVDRLEALDIECSNLPSRALKVLVRRAYLVSLFENRRTKAGIASTVDAYFVLGVPTTLLPVTKDFAVLRWKNLKTLSDSLALSIVLQIAWRATGADLLASNLRTAYAEFLSAHHIATPTAIAHSNLWPREQIIYFLRFVAVPEVIDMSVQVQAPVQLKKRDGTFALPSFKSILTTRRFTSEKRSRLRDSLQFKMALGFSTAAACMSTPVP